MGHVLPLSSDRYLLHCLVRGSPNIREKCAKHHELRPFIRCIVEESSGVGSQCTNYPSRHLANAGARLLEQRG